MKNVDLSTVNGFGEEWTAFDQSGLKEPEQAKIFQDYFQSFPWDEIPSGAFGADLGCGSGRWASVVAPRVGSLLVMDASNAALNVARRNLQNHQNVSWALGSVNQIPTPDASLDFAYSLGVLHHVPDTAGALAAIATKLKPGAPFLVYLYYALDHSPFLYRVLWRLSNGIRQGVSRLPWQVKRSICDALALLVYLPLSKAALAQEKIFGRVSRFWPLAYYRDKSFYVMRTDSLDRFGTRLEQRFTREQIEHMLFDAGFSRVKFSDRPPYWTAVAYRSNK